MWWWWYLPLLVCVCVRVGGLAYEWVIVHLLCRKWRADKTVMPSVLTAL